MLDLVEAGEAACERDLRELRLRREEELERQEESDGAPEEQPCPDARRRNGHAPLAFFSIFAHESRRETDRLKTGLAGAESGSTLK